jgi:hypothetical protein
VSGNQDQVASVRRIRYKGTNATTHCQENFYGIDTMSGPYFQKQPWQAFTFQGTTYDLGHLDEYAVETADSGGINRRIAISFSDHCFTREPVTGDDPGLRFPDSTRTSGHFCLERYRLSLDLPQHLAHAMQGKVWTIEGENFAAIPVIDHQGNKIFYGIVFSLDRVKKRPVDLDMRVRTAYPCDTTEIVTYGSVRFAHLVTLRMQGKHPNRNFARNRPRPRLS